MRLSTSPLKQNHTNIHSKENTSCYLRSWSLCRLLSRELLKRPPRPPRLRLQRPLRLLLLLLPFLLQLKQLLQLLLLLLILQRLLHLLLLLLLQPTGLTLLSPELPFVSPILLLPQTLRLLLVLPAGRLLRCLVIDFLSVFLCAEVCVGEMLVLKERQWGVSK